ncbi:hypothetical protein D3C71_1607950 [compost metagenome]
MTCSARCCGVCRRRSPLRRGKGATGHIGSAFPLRPNTRCMSARARASSRFSSTKPNGREGMASMPRSEPSPVATTAISPGRRIARETNAIPSMCPASAMASVDRPSKMPAGASSFPRARDGSSGRRATKPATPTRSGWRPSTARRNVASLSRRMPHCLSR